MYVSLCRPTPTQLKRTPTSPTLLLLLQNVQKSRTQSRQTHLRIIFVYAFTHNFLSCDSCQSFWRVSRFELCPLMALFVASLTSLTCFHFRIPIHYQNLTAYYRYRHTYTEYCQSIITDGGASSSSSLLTATL